MLMPDTGSYETWVNPNCSYGAATDPNMCVRNLHYDLKKSQLGRYLNGTWHMVYGTGEAIGRYVEDRFYYRRENFPPLSPFPPLSGGDETTLVVVVVAVVAVVAVVRGQR
jgi:hypothetical protein